jgi:hypothetical protein
MTVPSRVRQGFLMAEFAVYWISAGMLSVITSIGILWLYQRKKKLRRTLLAVLILILLAPIAPYARVTWLTWRYKTALLPAVRAAVAEINGQPLDVRACRIMAVNGMKADVFVVTPCTPLDGKRTHECVGEVYTLVRKGSAWKFSGDYRTVWSDCGSADGNLFPPYPRGGSYL